MKGTWTQTAPLGWGGVRTTLLPARLIPAPSPVRQLQNPRHTLSIMYDTPLLNPISYHVGVCLSVPPPCSSSRSLHSRRAPPMGRRRGRRCRAACRCWTSWTSASAAAAARRTTPPRCAASASPPMASTRRVCLVPLDAPGMMASLRCTTAHPANNVCQCVLLHRNVQAFRFTSQLATAWHSSGDEGRQKVGENESANALPADPPSLPVRRRRRLPPLLERERAPRRPHQPQGAPGWPPGLRPPHVRPHPGPRPPVSIESPAPPQRRGHRRGSLWAGALAAATAGRSLRGRGPSRAPPTRRSGGRR